MSLPTKDMKNDPAFLQEQYELVFIKYFEGYSCLEIADILQIPIQTVKERLRRSKRKLSIDFKIFTKKFRSSIKWET